MDALDAVLPLVSVLIGSAITYWLNVRMRRRTKAEDILHEAIAAVAVAVTARDFIGEVAPWRGSTSEEHARFTAQLGMEGNASYVRAVPAARAAVAKASAYEPALRQYLDATPTTFLTHADAILATLRRRTV